MKFSFLRKISYFIVPLALLAVLSLTMSASAQQQKLDLGKYHGKIVYLDFWASWCGPCKLSFPFMEGLKYNYQSKDLVVVTINLDHSYAAARNFLRKMNSNLNVIYDPKGTIAKTYHVSDMPTSFLIDRTGKIRFIHKGFHPDKKAEYMAQINQLVREH